MIASYLPTRGVLSTPESATEVALHLLQDRLLAELTGDFFPHPHEQRGRARPLWRRSIRAQRVWQAL